MEEPRVAAAPAAPPSPAPHVAVAGSPPFSQQLWQLVDKPGGLFQAILAHPFLVGLREGTLPEEVFRGYLVQDALYLRVYGKCLALVAAKAPRPDWTTFFCECSMEASRVEQGFHREFMAYWDTTMEEAAAGAVQSPNNLGYTSYQLAVIHERAFYEGLAAVLPCFVVYLEVGKALTAAGSRHPLYQKWIDKYGGEEYEKIVLKVVHMVNEVAEDLTATQRQRMAEVWLTGCRWELLFWDGAYRQLAWPCC